MGVAPQLPAKLGTFLGRTDFYQQRSKPSTPVRKQLQQGNRNIKKEDLEVLSSSTCSV